MPCIRDTRVTVSMVLGQLAAGRTVEELVDDYPISSTTTSPLPSNTPPP